jgi:SAM-dependent methyltransferase
MTMPILASTRTFIRKNGFMRWITSPVTSSYARMWDIEGVSLGRAKRMMASSSVTDEEFEAEGMANAAAIRERLPERARVLDLGCGIGRIALYVAPYCAELHGVDVSPRMLQLARRRLQGLRNIHLSRVNGTDLHQFADDSFDYAYCIQVLHQVEREHAMRYMIELARVVRPGGGVYLHFISLEDPASAELFREYALESKVLRVSRRRYFTESEVEVYSRLARFQDVSVARQGDSLILTAVVS